jgi:hypothetical protein
MNALFLKDLADKTHRGLRGRVEGGKSAGGLCYGYRVVKSLTGGTVRTGEREIEPTEAAFVERIFREFVAGVAPKAIAKRLNRDGIAGPFGGTWSPSTIHGNSKRGTGILNNELYVGRLIWNRLRFVKNPDTGKRISGRRGTSDRVAGQSGGDAGSDRTNEEVVGIRRPLPASIFGCGGGFEPPTFGL